MRYHQWTETVKVIPGNLVTYKVFGEPDGPHYGHYDIVGGPSVCLLFCLPFSCVKTFLHFKHNMLFSLMVWQHRHIFGFPWFCIMAAFFCFSIAGTSTSAPIFIWISHPSWHGLIDDGGLYSTSHIMPTLKLHITEFFCQWRKKLPGWETPGQSVMQENVKICTCTMHMYMLLL